jgi:hypothetical protein
VTTLLLFVCAVMAQPIDAGSAGVLALRDAGIADAGIVDANAADAGVADAGVADAGVADADVASPRAVDADGSALPDQGGARVVHLRGQILTKGSLGPVALATVTARTPDGQQTRIEADDDGRFDLVVGACGLALSVRAPGYQTLLLGHDACARPEPLLLRLVPRPNLPRYETVVTAQREQPSVDLRGPELTSTPGALGDPLRTIESLPGVAVVAWPAPIYAIRGSNPGNTGYFLDQLEVPLLFHLALGPSVIHPYFFDSMSFYPGGYPAEYGRYVAGVVATETRAPREDRLHASAEIRLYDAGALVSAPLPDGNGAVAAAFRYAYTGTLLSLVRSDVKLSYWDYQVRADRRARGWKLTLLCFGSGDDLNYRVDQQGFSNEYALQFHRASFRARRSLGGGQLSLQLALGYDHSVAPIVRDVYFVTASAGGVFPRIAFERSSEHWDLQLGSDGQLQRFWPTTNVRGGGTSDLVRKRTAALVGAYASATLHAGSRLTITPGIRWDGYSIAGTTRQDLGLRFAARIDLDPKTWLSASGGRFSQPPSLGVQLPAATSFGLSLYGLQTSWQAALGVGTRRLTGFELELTGYVQRYRLTDVRDPTLTEPDPSASDFLVLRNARSYGLEVMIRRPPTERLHGWIAYTLSQNQRALGGGVIGPSDWDQRHVLNAVVGCRMGAYQVGARWHLNTGRPVLVGGGQNEAFVRLPAFYQLDLRAERRFLFDAFTLDLYLEIVNATLTREVYQLDEAPDGSLSQRSLRVVLPSLGVRGEM